MSLVFEAAAPPAAPDSRRADVACFIGYVKRRPGQPLPAALQDQLTAAGWVGGLWARPGDQVDSLQNLPLVLDSWHLFDRLYAWDQRPLKEGGDAVCASYLGAAVRSFFARGGLRAVVVRVGDPWPFLEDGDARKNGTVARMRLLLPDYGALDGPASPFEPVNPASWQGIHHLYGLRDNSMLVLPDLPDLCAYAPPDADLTLPLAPQPEGFVECSSDEPVAPDDTLRRLPAPRLDDDGYHAWCQAIRAASAFLARWQREVLLVGALPLAHVDTRRDAAGGAAYAQGDMLSYLQRIGALPGGDGVADAGASSAFVQLAWPWLRTQAASGDLPEGLEPADGALAGLVAASAARRGTFRSAAGDFSMPYLRDVADAEPVPAWGAGEDSPAALLARHVCTIAPSASGWALQSDVTTSADDAWRLGGVSRLVGCLLRAARGAGDEAAFDGNGPSLWARLQTSLEDLLMAFCREGAFAGATSAEAFSVRCDRSTMTQADLDAGRLIVEVSVWPAVSIERITVVMNLSRADGASSLREAA